MKKSSHDVVLITNPITEPNANVMRGDRQSKVKAVEVSIESLTRNTKVFLSQINHILSEDEPDENSRYEMEKVEISASITSSGKLAILGNGIELSGQGGVKFVLKRKKS